MKLETRRCVLLLLVLPVGGLALEVVGVAAGGDALTAPVAPVVLESGTDAAVPASQLPRNDPCARSAGRVVQLGTFVSRQVNVDELGQNILGDAANEPSIAIDPTDPDNMAIGWRQFDTVASSFRQAGWGYSHDRGATWTFPGVIDPGHFRSDPVLVADLDGQFFYNGLTNDPDWICTVYKSTDAGESWPTDGYAFGGDKPWTTIDLTGGIGSGNIYVKWQSFFNCCGLDTFTRSTDGGQTFMEPISVPLGPSFGSIAVGPDGEVYVAGTRDQVFDDIVIARSTDAANPSVTPSFDLSTHVNLGGTVVIGAAPNPAGLLGQVWVDVDRSDGPTRGNVYMVASVDPPGADPMDVMFVRSEDGGATWSAPDRINDDFSVSNWQWFGTFSVAPNGRIDVVWNDTRNTELSSLSELFFAFSSDAGQTWSGNVPLSPVFDSHLGWPGQNKLGDYYHMLSDNAGADLAYAATFNGEQDVYHLRISVDCNGNGVLDDQDITGGESEDVNTNGIPDECECPTDLNDNGTTNAADLALLLGAWGSNPGHLADLNHDDVVDASDLALLLAAWGPCS